MFSARPHPVLHRPRRRLATLILLAALLAACGASEPDDGPTVDPAVDGPRVADPRFEGDFRIAEVDVDGQQVALGATPRLTIDTEFGALNVVPGCNTRFGSFSLDEDGRASFTVTGGTDTECGDLAAQEEAILAALARADAWVETDDGFEFLGAGSRLRVIGPAG